VIVLAVRWYLRFGLSYRDVEELLTERGIQVDHVTVYRWVRRFTPLLAEASTVASGDHSNRRSPPESLNAIGDAKIDCFEHFWPPPGRAAAPLCYPPTPPSGQMQQCPSRPRAANASAISKPM
jgi:hypothetical protein